MNELKINGTQNFMGIYIPVIEGGFGKNQKTLLVKTVAQIHNVQVKELNKLINNNIDEFDFGIDILDLKTGDFKEPVLENKLLTKAEFGNSNNVYLLSEQGYYALVQLMKTEKAKEIRKKLRREYFAMREIISSIKQKKAMLLLTIYDGGQNAVSASKELTNLEVDEATAPLIAENKELKPKAEFHDIVHASENSISVGKFSGVLQKNIIFKNFGRNKLFQWLRNNDYLCTCGDLKNKPTQKALSNGYMDYDEYVSDNGFGKSITTYKPLITGKGQIYFTEKLIKDFKEE